MPRRRPDAPPRTPTGSPGAPASLQHQAFQDAILRPLEQHPMEIGIAAVDQHLLSTLAILGIDPAGQLADPAAGAETP